MSKANASGKGSKKWIKWIIILVVVVLLAVIVISAVSSAKMMSGMTMASTFELEKKDLENTVSISGIVESQEFRQVTSKLSYNVEKINVEVGDRVKTGDILATLNTSDLEDQILQQQTSIDSSSVNLEYSLSDAEKRYNEAREQISNGTYPEIRSAKLSLENAETALNKARDKYNEQLGIQGSDRDTQLNSARKGVESAKEELEYARADYLETKKDVDEEDYSSIRLVKKTYEDAKKEYDTRFSSVKSSELQKASEKYESTLSNYTYLSSMARYDPSSVSAESVSAAQRDMQEAQTKLAELEKKYNIKTTEDTYKEALEAYTVAKADIDSANSVKLKNAERAYNRAQTSYENAQNTLNSVLEGNNTSIKNYKDAVDDAQESVDKARETYNLAVKNADSSLASLKSAADREKLLSGNDSQLLSLELLKNKLDDCVIKAPCDGTVTAVNAVEGSPAAGTLFIIEDLDNLKMNAVVKEYSVTELSPDLNVTVTIPSLNNREFEGVISKIAPTSTKGMDGKSDGASSFNVEVLIRGTKEQGVLIGMTSKCRAVTGSAENVFSVTYDAIVEDDKGNSYVFVPDMIEGKNGASTGTATVRKISVETGFESDAEIEIRSSELTEGMKIISNAGDVSDGDVVILSDAFGAALQNAMGSQEQ